MHPRNKANFPEIRTSITISKAKQMLKDDSAQGHPLTQKQKGLFGLIAGGGKPTRVKKY